MNRRLGLGVLAAVTTIGLMMGSSSNAEAQELNGLGARGQMILTADRLFPLFSYTNVSVTRTQGNTTLTSSDSGSSMVLLIGTEPQVSSIHTIPRAAFDFTIIDRLTLGGTVALGFGLGGSSKRESFNGNTTVTAETDSPTRTIFGIGPRVGYILPLGEVVGFWFRGGISYYSDVTKDTFSPGNNPNVTVTRKQSDHVLSLDLDPQLMIVPIPHFFFHVGPIVNIPMTGGRRTESGNTSDPPGDGSNDLSVFHLGISTGIGGWFDL
jgi:hypothetical protein